MAPQENNAPGASAQREYDRRSAKDEAATRAKWGMLGGLAVAFGDERQSTAAWKSGARGEVVVGGRLDAVASEHIVVLHDRRLPRSRANIDHLVVTPGGVWVVDAKRYVNKRPTLRVEGGLLRPRVERLVVGGDKTSLVDGVVRQRDAVVEAVESLGAPVPVTAALCFVEADWPLIGGSFSIRGVEVCWPKKLVTYLDAARGEVDVPAVAAALARRFPPA